MNKHEETRNSTITFTVIPTGPDSYNEAPKVDETKPQENKPIKAAFEGCGCAMIIIAFAIAANFSEVLEVIKRALK